MFKPIFLATAALLFSATTMAEDIPTRFGSLKINSEGMVLFKNRPLNPEIEGASGIYLPSILGTYQIDNKDLVLIKIIGGAMCPAVLHFVSVSASGAKSTAEFGSCSDIITVEKNYDSISVTMPGFVGSLESKAAQRKASKEKHVYVFNGVVLTENGKQIK